MQFGVCVQVQRIATGGSEVRSAFLGPRSGSFELFHKKNTPKSAVFTILPKKKQVVEERKQRK